MRKILFFLLLLYGLESFSQALEHDWQNYIVDVNDKPVSINVDLGLAKAAPIKERPIVIICRIKLLQPDTKGMPYPEEYQELLNMEDVLVEQLGKETGAVFVGRFTQRGLREFYFYAPDSVGYRKAMFQAMSKFPTYEWLSQAKDDSKWENFFTVLYPSERELMRLRSRNEVDRLLQNANGQKKSLMIEHAFAFKNENDRSDFLKSFKWDDHKIVSIPENPDFLTGKYLLIIRGKGVPDMIWVERFVMRLFDQVKKFQGTYLSWQPSATN